MFPDNGKKMEFSSGRFQQAQLACKQGVKLEDGAISEKMHGILHSITGARLWKSAWNSGTCTDSRRLHYYFSGLG
jgi:hypothetical protein